MRVLHEIDCPHHSVAVRFSHEEFYLCDYHSRACRMSSQRVWWGLMNEIMSNSSSCETEVRSDQKLSHKCGSAIKVVNDCVCVSLTVDNLSDGFIDL